MSDLINKTSSHAFAPPSLVVPIPIVYPPACHCPTHGASYAPHGSQARQAFGLSAITLVWTSIQFVGTVAAGQLPIDQKLRR